MPITVESLLDWLGDYLDRFAHEKSISPCQILWTSGFCQISIRLDDGYKTFTGETLVSALLQAKEQIEGARASS